MANPNSFRTGDNPGKSITKGNLRQLQKQRHLFPPNFSGRISTGEGGAGTSEHLPVDDYSLWITGFKERNYLGVPSGFSGGLLDSMAAASSGQVLIYRSRIFTRTVL